VFCLAQSVIGSTRLGHWLDSVARLCLLAPSAWSLSLVIGSVAPLSRSRSTSFPQRFLVQFDLLKTRGLLVSVGLFFVTLSLSLLATNT
jgi:hypothetical protein